MPADIIGANVYNMATSDVRAAPRARSSPTSCSSTRSTGCRRARRRRCSRRWRSGRSRSTAPAIRCRVVRRLRDTEPGRVRRHVSAARSASSIAFCSRFASTIPTRRRRGRSHPRSGITRLRRARESTRSTSSRWSRPARRRARGEASAVHGRAGAVRVHRGDRAADARVAVGRHSAISPRGSRSSAARRQGDRRHCHGRDYLVPDDVKAGGAGGVQASPDPQGGGGARSVTPDQVIADILAAVDVPK